MQKLSFFALAAAAVVAAACSDSGVTAPIHPTDNDVSGAWAMPFGGIPGNGMGWTLNDVSGNVTGTGTFTGEAGPFGTLAISGMVTNDTLRLSIIYKYDPATFPGLHGDTAQFVGVLTSHDEMTGTYTRLGTSGPFHMVRPTL